MNTESDWRTPWLAALLAALILLHLLWHAWLQDLPDALVVPITALFLLPLLACALGLWRNPRHAAVWIGLVILIYFCHGVTEAWSNPSVRPLALIEVALTIAYIAILGAGRKRRPKSSDAAPTALESAERASDA